jgi:hypothetical protein
MAPQAREDIGSSEEAKGDFASADKPLPLTRTATSGSWEPETLDDIDPDRANAECPAPGSNFLLQLK